MISTEDTNDITFLDINDKSTDFKIDLLKGLGFDSDGKYVLCENGEKYLDKYSCEPISIDNMFIFPGSTIIINNDAFSIISLMEEIEDGLQ